MAVSFIQLSLKCCTELQSVELLMGKPVDDLSTLLPVAASTSPLPSSFVVRFGQWEALSECQESNKIFCPGSIFWLHSPGLQLAVASFLFPMPQPQLAGPLKLPLPWVPVTVSPCSQLWLMEDALSYCPNEEASSPSTKSLVYRVCLFLDLSVFTHFKYSICFLWEPDKKHLI